MREPAVIVVLLVIALSMLSLVQLPASGAPATASPPTLFPASGSSARASTAPPATGAGARFASSHDPHAVNVPELIQQELAKVGPRLAIAPSTTPSGAPHPEVPSLRALARLLATGNVSGTVLDLIRGTPVRGAVVTAYSVPGGICVASGCTGVSTNSSGGFAVPAPIGADVVYVAAGFYLTNETWVTVPYNGRVSAGTIGLVHDAIVSGTVEDDLPDHATLSNVAVNSTSRDGAVLASPGAITGTNGNFTVAVAPLPSVITFSPQRGSGYVANRTFENLTPWQKLDLGVVHLEGGLLVNATLVDRATGKTIGPKVESQLVVCTRRTGYCVPSVNGLGPNVSGPGLSGPSSVEAMAVGYVVNDTTIPDLPANPSSLPVHLGKIYLTPMGAFEISTNFTGGTPSTVWPAGNVTAVACSLQGVHVPLPAPPGIFQAPGLTPSLCWPLGLSSPGVPTNTYRVGNTTLGVGPPLEDAIVLVPASGDVFPVSYAPVADQAILSVLTPPPPGQGTNITWANLTPDRVTHLGSVDETPGNYLTGTVAVAGNATSYASACSTDQTGLCAARSGLATVTGCRTGANSFCIPAPAGPDLVTFTAPSFGVNRTWVTVPRGCCAQQGHPIDLGTVNISGGAGPEGFLTGRAWVTNPPLPWLHEPIAGLFASVTACEVDPARYGQYSNPCASTIVDSASGNFSLQVATGWNQVTVFPSGYRPNTTWIDVVGTNDTGTIFLTPDAFLAGRVVGTDGIPVYAASISACPVGLQQLCAALGSGTLTNTAGEYNGSIRGAPFPGGSYEIIASAAGFSPGWTWMNATSGNLTIVPTILLTPLGSHGVAARPSPHQSAAPLLPTTVYAGAWVDGRVVDARTNLGVPGVAVTACSVGAGGCSIDPESSPYDGSFNLSLASGYFHLFLNATNYPSDSIFLNLSASRVDHLGVIPITAFSWVRGRVAIGPWASLTLSEGLGPADASARACDGRSITCGSVGPIDSAGFFNVSAPPGLADQLLLRGRGIATFGSSGDGYGRAGLLFNTTGAFTDLLAGASSVPHLPIFGGFTGFLRDGSVRNLTTSVAERPVAFGIADAGIPGGINGPAVSFGGGGGYFAIFLPSFGTQTDLRGSSLAYRAANATLHRVPASGVVAPVANLTLQHFGWVTGAIADLTTGARVGDVLAATSLADPANGTAITSTGAADQDGRLNITAPAGTTVVLSLTAVGYANRSLSLIVAQSVAAKLSLTNLTEKRTNTSWISSAQIDSVGHPPTVTVRDLLTHAPLGGARVTVTASNSTSVSPAVYTNDLGQFLVPVPVDPVDTVQVDLTGYARANASYLVPAGGRVVVPKLNVTGDGIIGGWVVAAPSGLPVPGILLMACPTGTLVCSHVATTNATGAFWVDAPAGLDVVTILTNSYLVNSTTTVAVPTDTWVGVGALPVYAFANVTGTVRALPYISVLGGANVSLCSPFGSPAGPCTESVTTDALGNFTLFVPPGIYVLKFSALGFNTSYLSVDVLPGESLRVGTIFLFAEGLLRGSVVDGENGSTIVGASVTVCSLWSGGSCLPSAPTDANGSFLALADPGNVGIAVSAGGYLDASERGTAVSGQLVVLPALRMQRLPPSTPETVTGRIVELASPNTGIATGIVIARSSGVLGGSAPTDGQGYFTLTIPWGSYTLTAIASGYRPSQTNVTLHANTSGLSFPLAVMTFDVRGTITDPGGVRPLAGVNLDLGTVVETVTDGHGRFALTYANGSYSMTAVPPPGTPYQSVGFSVVVNGANAEHNLSLPFSGVPLIITVVSKTTGVAIAGAIVGLNATLAGGIVLERAGKTDALGAFTTTAPPGLYTVSVIASGYAPATTTVAVANLAVELSLELPNEVGVSTAGSGLPTTWLALGGAAVAAAVVAGAILLWRRRPRPPEYAVGESMALPLPPLVEYEEIDPEETQSLVR